MIRMSMNLVPVHQWTHRKFDGVDPWENNQPVQWSVVVYRMVSDSLVLATPVAKQTVPAESNDVPKQLAVGIFSEAHNRYRVLPQVVQDLWRARQVRDEDLPWLLHRIEEPLRLNDYPPSRLQRLMLQFSIILGVFLVYLVLRVGIAFAFS